MSAVKSLKGRLNKAAAPSERVLTLNLDDIRTDPQVRTKFDLDKLNDLAEQLKASGQMQPIVVRETPDLDKPYTVHVGERRFRASRIAGLKTIDAIVRDIDPKLSRIQQFAENSGREDLSLQEEIDFVMEELKTMTGAELAKAIGKPTGWVSKRKTLGGAGEATQRVLDGELSGDSEAIYQLCRLEKSDPDRAKEFVDGLVSGEISSENFRDQINEINSPKPKQKPGRKNGESEEETGDNSKAKTNPKTDKSGDKPFTVTAIEHEEDYIKVVTDQGLLIFDSSLSDFLAFKR